MKASNSIHSAEIIQNVIIGLTVSFVALSLGAALGILSGRGAFAGMFSAGIIALITAIFGGTRVQCSGPTAPMSAVSAVVVAYAFEQISTGILAINADHFINLVFILCGALMLLMGVLRLGRFINLVPNVVISGFMNGIALLIWLDQLRMLFGFGGKKALAGPTWQNLTIALVTLILIFIAAPLTRKIVDRLARFLPATLLAILVMTFATSLLGWQVEVVNLSGGFSTFNGFLAMAKQQIPTEWSAGILLAALPFALQLAMLGYLDTLLTSLVVDKMGKEQTRLNKELLAQGLANSTIGFLGGIPGAQATIRSVLMLKEGASLRLAGIMVGIFVIIEMILFQDFLNQIPKAVFVGVLFKVGYDVFDVKPMRLYAKQVALKRATMFTNFFSRHDDEPIFITNREMLIILGSSLVTLCIDLNTAVIGFTMLFYLHNNLLNKRNPLRDLQPPEETERFLTQN